jgi:ubiquitin-like modifier-activating enzyme ATG7
MKKYKFSYWFAFPAIHSNPPWVPVPNNGAEAQTSTAELTGDNLPGSRNLTGHESSTLVDAVQTWRYGVDSRQHGFFLARKDHLSARDLATRTSNVPAEQQDNRRQSNISTNEIGISWTVSSLSGFEAGFFQGARPEDCFICFADPSNYPKAPGWMLRNLLVLVRRRWALAIVQILRYRDVQSQRDQGRSVVMCLQSAVHETLPNNRETSNSDQIPKFTGWERNAAGKLIGRNADLTEYMDPQRFA